jgi:hypothetical protein
LPSTRATFAATATVGVAENEEENAAKGAAEAGDDVRSSKCLPPHGAEATPPRVDGGCAATLRVLNSTLTRSSPRVFHCSAESSGPSLTPFDEPRVAKERVGGMAIEDAGKTRAHCLALREGSKAR